MAPAKECRHHYAAHARLCTRIANADGLIKWTDGHWGGKQVPMHGEMRSVLVEMGREG